MAKLMAAMFFSAYTIKKYVNEIQKNRCRKRKSSRVNCMLSDGK